MPIPSMKNISKWKTGPRKGLNMRQWRFCESYLKHGVARRAAIDAGYSERSASAQASELLRNPAVRQYLARERKLERKNRILTTNQILEQLTKIGLGKQKQEEFVALWETEPYKTDSGRLKYRRKQTIVKKKRRPDVKVQKDALTDLLEYINKAEDMIAKAEQSKSIDSKIMQALQERGDSIAEKVQDTSDFEFEEDEDIEDDDDE